MTSLGLSFAEAAINDTFKAVNPFGKSNNPNGINWGDYNYPPCLSIMHYNLDDIQHESNQVVADCMHKVFLLSFANCVLNFIDTTVNTTIYADADGSWIIYSILNFVLIVPIALYIFHSGYKGLALMDSSYLSRYMFMGTIQALFYFMFTLLHFGALNGLLSFAIFRVGVFWTVAIILESLLWITALGLCLYTVIYIHRGKHEILLISTSTKHKSSKGKHSSEAAQGS